MPELFDEHYISTATDVPVGTHVCSWKPSPSPALCLERDAWSMVKWLR